MHQYPHWNTSSYRKTHLCGFTCRRHLCLLDATANGPQNKRLVRRFSTNRMLRRRGTKGFHPGGVGCLHQQVCNRLKGSLLKELGPEPRPLLEAIIGRVCRLDTHRAGRRGWEGAGLVVVAGWGVSEFHNLSFQYANDQFKGENCDKDTSLRLFWP